MLILKQRLITMVIERCYGVPEQDEAFKRLVRETLFKIGLELVIQELKGVGQLPISLVLGRHLQYRRNPIRYIGQ